MGSQFESATIRDNWSESSNIPAIGDSVIRDSDPAEAGRFGLNDPLEARMFEQQLMDRSIISPYIQLNDGSYHFLPWHEGGNATLTGGNVGLDTSPKDVMLLAHRYDGDGEMHSFRTEDAVPQITHPFVDTGKNIEVGKPESWTLPTKENYAGWIPGTTPNFLVWGNQANDYVGELMRQNFAIDSDGQRKAISQLGDNTFKHNFGNAVRHAMAVGDLVFNQGHTPEEAEKLMMLHEIGSPIVGFGNAIKKAS